MALQGTFSYDPSAYITAASQWANEQKARGDTEYTWAKDQFAKNQATSDKVVNAALDQGNYWDDTSRAGMDAYMRMYPQAMQEQLDFARNYATPEKLAFARGQAIADVGQAFDAQAKEASDNLESYGLKPQDVASRLDASVRTQRAAASAAAGTQSDVNRELVGQQLLGNAIQTGQGLAGVASGAAGVSQAARNQAINTGLATTASGSSTRGTPMQWTAMGNQELSEWPKAQVQQNQLSNDFYKNQDASQLAWAKQGDESSSGIGAILGTAASIGMKAAPLMFSGGVVPSFDEGGPVMPSTAIQTGTVVPPGTGVPSIPGQDKVPALVAEGEGVLPKDVMDWIGEQGFQKLIAKVRKERQTQTQTEPQDSTPEAAAIAQQAGPQFASEGAMA